MTLACFIKFRFANFLFEAMFTINLNKNIEMCEQIISVAIHTQTKTATMD